MPYLTADMVKEIIGQPLSHMVARRVRLSPSTHSEKEWLDVNASYWNVQEDVCQWIVHKANTMCGDLTTNEWGARPGIGMLVYAGAI